MEEPEGPDRADEEAENDATMEYWKMTVGFKALNDEYISRVTFLPYTRITVSMCFLRLGDS